jgi:hypothetical protein
MVETLHAVGEGGGRWRWVYRDVGEGVELRSSATYGSRTEAEEAATAIYPGVPLEAPAGVPVDDAGASGLFDRRSLLPSAASSIAALGLFFLALRAVGRKSGGTPDVRRRRSDRKRRSTRRR